LEGKSVELTMCSHLGYIMDGKDMKKKFEGRAIDRVCSPHNNPGTHEMIQQTGSKAFAILHF
jgi:hypothetical protein